MWSGLGRGVALTRSLAIINKSLHTTNKIQQYSNVWHDLGLLERKKNYKKWAKGLLISTCSFRTKKCLLINIPR